MLLFIFFEKFSTNFRMNLIIFKNSVLGGIELFLEIVKFCAKSQLFSVKILIKFHKKFQLLIVDEDEIGKVYQSLPVMVAALDDFLSKLLKQCLQGKKYR